MDYKLQQSIASTKRKDATKQAMKELMDTVGSMGGDEDFAQGIFEALLETHRTTQQTMIRAFATAMVSYSGINTDLRNMASVDFAKKITEMEHHFPTV